MIKFFKQLLSITILSIAPLTVATQPGCILIINGTSCAGKSTITQALADALKTTYTIHECTAQECLTLAPLDIIQPTCCILHVDDIWEYVLQQQEDTHRWHKALEATGYYARYLASLGNIVLLDTSITAQEDFAVFQEIPCYKILAYAPLSILCERDRQRGIARPYNRNVMYRYYILECFAHLYRKASSNEYAVDTLSLSEIRKAVSSVPGKTIVEPEPVLEEIAASIAQQLLLTDTNSSSPITLALKHDLVINTHTTPLHTCIELILQRFF